jgi:hypothetical protein
MPCSSETIDIIDKKIMCPEFPGVSDESNDIIYIIYHFGVKTLNMCEKHAIFADFYKQVNGVIASNKFSR